MLRYIALALFSIFIVSPGFAQKREKRKAKQSSTQQLPNSLNPSYPLSDYAPSAKSLSKSAVKSSNITFDQEVKDYYARKAQVIKAEKKWERISKKPQYSDPSYFGHKHKPKKHPPGKMKYCKECGMWH